MSVDSGNSSEALQITKVDQRIWDQALELTEQSKFGNYSLPDPNSSLYLQSITKGKDLIALGICSEIIEATITVDESRSVKDRMRAIQMLLDNYKFGVYNSDKLHAFIQDPEFSKILQRHFGFRKHQGEALYLEL